MEDSTVDSFQVLYPYSIHTHNQYSYDMFANTLGISFEWNNIAKADDWWQICLT